MVNDYRFSKLITKDDDFYCLIEISKGSKNKYEYDENTGLLVLDRILYTSTHYPHNYGFIPNTFAADGDALDCLVLCSETIVPMSLVRCKPIGVLNMIDQNKDDFKVIAVPFNDPTYCGYNDINEIPSHVLDEIKHFFRVYKTLEGKNTDIKEVDNSTVAKKIIAECIEEFKKLD